MLITWQERLTYKKEHRSIMALSDLEFNIAITRHMKLTWPNAERYLKAKGFDVKERTYWRKWGTIQTMAISRAEEIAKRSLALHMDRLDKFRTIEEEMWLQYHQETKPYLKVKILESISKVLVTVTALEEATEGILRGDGLLQSKQEETGELVPQISQGQEDRADS